MIHTFKHRKGQTYEQIKLEKKEQIINFFLLILTL